MLGLGVTTLAVLATALAVVAGVLLRGR